MGVILHPRALVKRSRDDRKVSPAVTPPTGNFYLYFLTFRSVLLPKLYMA